MNEIRVGDMRIAYESVGAGPPVVLLHGILADSRLVRWQLDDLADAFSVFAWDAPGCGRSSDPAETWRMPDYADCLAEWITLLGIAQPHVLGVSWGGCLALELYRRHPSLVGSLILADSYAGWAGSLPPEVCAARLESCLRQSELSASAFIPGWMPGLLTDAAPDELRAEVTAVMSDFHPAGYRVAAHALAEADYLDTLAEVRVPTLLLWGEHDERAPISIGEDLHDRIRGSELVRIAGAGHLANAEASGRFNAEVRRFVRSRGARVAIESDTAEAFLRSVVTPRRRESPRLSEPLREVEARRVATPYGTVAVWRIGAGPATLLVHGWEDDNSLWEPMIATLVDRGHAVVVFDLPAHGFSDGDWGLGFEATDATRAVADACGPVEAIVAHSMGAGSAALAVSEGLVVRSCVLIAPPLVGGNRWHRVADRMGVAIEAADRAQAVYEARIGARRVTNYDLRELLPQLETRVLVVHSADDERMPFRESHDVCVVNASVELLTVDGLRHRATARDPRVTRRIADFIESAD